MKDIKDIFKRLYPISVTVIITALLSFMTATAYYNGRLFLKPGSMSKLGNIETILEKYYYEDYSKEYAYEEASRGYVNSLGDPYTEYFSADDLMEFENLVNSSYCGIGVTVQNNIEDNTLLIIDIFENSPAYKAGIQVNDVITKINDVSYKGEQLDEATNDIHGEEGTEVKVTVLKGDSGKEVDYNIKRQNIVVDSVMSEVLDDNIGYIAISVFATKTGAEFAQHLDDLLSQNIEGLIVDVRDNGGGIDDAVEAVADCLLPKDAVIYYTADKHNSKDYIKSKMGGIDTPLVILANENSASASEILVGAIKDNERGVIVGKKTFGKGVVQQLFPLTSDTALKVTVEKYFTPKGDYIHKKGIEPDYTVEIEGDTDTQLLKAIEILKTQ